MAQKSNWKQHCQLFKLSLAGTAERSENGGGGLKSSGSSKNGGLRACLRIIFKVHPLNNQRNGYCGIHACPVKCCIPYWYAEIRIIDLKKPIM